MSLLGGKKPAKIQGARQIAAKAAKADCQATEGCGLPHAKLWEKGGALMAYLEASRMKQENNTIDLVATAKDKYRKPAAGAWTHLVSEANGGVAPDLPRCIYVGDAAGRPQDHSDTDRGFARAVGVPFQTETEFWAQNL